MEPIAALAVPLRWLHVVSFVILLGGIFYARYFVGSLSPRFRGWIFASIGGLLASGLYTFLTKPSYPAGYQAWTSIRADVQEVVDAFVAAGDSKVLYFQFATQSSPYGEDWHPTVATHQTMADALIPFVEEAQGW